METRKLFSPKECASIIETLNDGLTVGRIYDGSTHPNYCATDRPVTNEPRWAFERFRFRERVYLTSRFIRYQAGDYFRWHTDTKSDDLLCSISVQLSDSSSYEGGDLMIGSETAPREQGNAVIFNPYTWHRVTEGQRFALIVWVHKV